MPIIIEIDRDAPIDVSFFTRESDGVVTFDLGDCPETGLSYSLFCSLHPTIFPNRMEFAFWIADYDPATKQMSKIWDGNATKHLLVGEDRLFVRGLICEALRGMAERFMPHAIFIQTMEPNLPDKALEKYRDLGRVLIGLGYDCKRLSPFHDREAWLAKRQDV